MRNFGNNNNNHHGGGGGGSAGSVQPISSLSPFIGNRWTIRGRVTDKSDVRTWNKPTSSGKLMSFTLVDESASIRATMFNGAVDLFNQTLTPNSVFSFSNGQVKTANKRFNNVNNEYEVTFDENTLIEPVRGDTAAHIPQQRYNFVPISVLPQREAQTMCEVLCVIVNVGDVSKIIQKSTGQELTRRTVRLADKGASVDLALWGDQALNFDCPVGTVVAVRNARIGTFDGCSLSTGSGFSVDANPPLPDTQALAQWFATTGGSDVECISGRRGNDEDNSTFRGRRFLDDIQREGLGKGEKPDWIDVRVTPFYLRADNVMYEACPTCNRKVLPDGGNGYRCEKCQRTLAHPAYRYMASLHVSDNYTTAWVTLYNEGGEMFFGQSAEQLAQATRNDPQYLVQYVARLLFQPMILRLRVKEEAMMGSGGGADAEQRLRLSCNKLAYIQVPLENLKLGDPQMAAKISFASESAAIIDQLKAYVQ